MPIEKKTTRVVIGDNRVRYRVRVTGEACTPNTHESRVFQGMFMHWIADNPHLLYCGPETFDKVVITHNGIAWQAEAEAEVEENTS